MSFILYFIFHCMYVMLKINKINKYCQTLPRPGMRLHLLTANNASYRWNNRLEMLNPAASHGPWNNIKLLVTLTIQMHCRRHTYISQLIDKQAKLVNWTWCGCSCDLQRVSILTLKLNGRYAKLTILLKRRLPSSCLGYLLRPLVTILDE